MKGTHSFKMLTDYKFAYIKRDDDGFITEAAIRFYEGEVIEVDDVDIETGAITKVQRYVRSKKLASKDLKHLKCKFKKDINNGDVSIYTVADFGKIKTDEQLCTHLDNETVKDKKRSHIKADNA